jgi:2'-5' RNA ligase
MRLFTGIAIAPHVLTNLEALITELKPLARLKWSPAENLHITTRFIGEWPETKLPELEKALAGVPRPGAIAITLPGFGFMPNPHRPRVFFAAVEAGPELTHLAAAIDSALEPLGCKREDRAYHPHLTLARVSNDNIRELRERIAEMKNPDPGSFEATEFHLYLSTPGPKGSAYKKLASYALGDAAGQSQ